MILINSLNLRDDQTLHLTFHVFRVPPGNRLEALRTHFGEAVYRPNEAERAALVAGLEEAHVDPTSVRDWSDVRAHLTSRR